MFHHCVWQNHLLSRRSVNKTGEITTIKCILNIVISKAKKKFMKSDINLII